MIYIVDAYNVIHKIARLEALLDRDLRSARDGLIELCGRIAAIRGDISGIILVFDGNSQYQDLPQANPPKIKVVFSETGEDADERIVTILEGLPGENKCVVSDDNFVRNHARAYRARVVPVAQFERLLDTRSKNKGAGKKAPETPSLPPRIAKEITEAYKKMLGL